MMGDDLSLDVPTILRLGRYGGLGLLGGRRVHSRSE